MLYFVFPTWRLRTCIFHPWPHPLVQSHPYCTVQTERPCLGFPLAPLSTISTIFLSVLFFDLFFFLFVFFSFMPCSSSTVEQKCWDAESWTKREREKREADALFFIVDSHLSVGPEKDTLNKIFQLDEWGNCSYDVGIWQADDTAVYFHLKHVQDLQKLKEWKKFGW